uniref:Membrane protein n=1 Tax=uncultured bacterium Csd4 TaxID=1637487 RepID=A0A0F6WGH6_9BACT|nr:membrane protein [uncultured bacterium Csd4]
MEFQAMSDNYSTPDQMVEAYNEVTSDLAFAQTHYPNSPITNYLNDLALGLHHNLYRNKRTSWSSFVRFWTHDIPLCVYQSRKALLLSLLIFVTTIIVGIVSTYGDPEFPRLILGDAYIDMTLENIDNGEPMAVYGGDSQLLSFLGITVNNVMVSFMIFVMGIFTSIGTGYYLMNNGVMVGAFVTFFIQRGLFVDSILAIMLHGTLELSAIVIAGGAGITMGNGWLFPGTYSRMRSFLIAARRGVKVLISTVPLFIVAGFIEGFFTRYTHAGDLLRLFVILISLVFIIFYYVLLPIKRHREEGHGA